jgi:hypothetical protein
MHLASSQAVLAGLSTGLGRTGLAAARVLPGLLAALDQHAADLRDRFTGGIGNPTTAELAGYCAGLIRTAEAAGWRRPEAAEVNWRGADWFVVRLVAACQLASGTA